MSDISIVKAEQQLTGFSHAYQGYDVTSLIQAMGLRVEEWHQLKEDMPFLPKDIVEEIDKYFEKEEGKHD